MMTGATGLLLLLIGTAAPVDAPRVYQIVRVGSAIDEAADVGVRRAGLACLPDGRLRWGDVATEGLLDRREVVQDALEDAGLPLVPFGADGMAGHPVANLRGLVQSADLRLCARHWPAKALSGTATMTIEWRVEDRRGGVATHVSTVARTVDGAHAVPLPAFYRLMLGDAARDLAHWLLSPA